MEWALLVLMGLQGYFTIFRLTPESYSLGKSFPRLKDTVVEFIPYLQDVVTTIKTLDQRLAELETEIKLRQMDSGRIIEWLDKRDRQLLELQKQFEKHLNLEVREKNMETYQSKIVEISENLRLITKK